MSRLRLLAPVILAASLAGCGPDYSPDTYSSTAVQQANKVEQGVIIGVRRVGVAAGGQTGAVAGAAAGGIMGSQVPGAGVTTAIGAVGGGLIGGIVGSGVDKTINDTSAFEYIVRKANAELISVTQRDASSMAVGQHVLVIAGNQARIIPDYTQVAEPPPQPMFQAQPFDVAPPPEPVASEPLITTPDATPTPATPDSVQPVAAPVPAPAPAPLAPPPPPKIERQPTPPTPPAEP